MPTIQELLSQAQQARQAGNSGNAETICRHILAHAAGCGAAWQLLGSLCAARGRWEEAVTCHTNAAQLLPDVADVHIDLGHAFQTLERWAEAEASYRRALEIAPDDPSTHANLGAIRQQQGKLDDAAASYRKALALKPTFAEVRANLAALCRQQGKLEEAADQYRRAISDHPEIAELHTRLGVVLKEQGHFDDAMAAFQSSLALEERYEARIELGSAFFRLNRLDEAIDCYRQAIGLNSYPGEAYNNLGTVYQEQGKLADALTAFQQAVTFDPKNAQAYNNMGVVHQDRDEFDAAVTCFRRALEIQPDFAEAYHNLAISLQYEDRLDESADALRKVIALKPEFADAHSQLGNVRKLQARHEEALACYRRALTQDPNSISSHSDLCFALQFFPAVTAAEIYCEHQRWNERHATALEKNAVPHTNERNWTRRLRIGYISPDFRNHCQTFFTKPLLTHHNHKEFEVFCYADIVKPDNITARLRHSADHWRDVYVLAASAKADLIRSDQIDVLVDLTMHMKGGHLCTMALRPAPVQICWLAYPGTTGLTAIDYRLTDPYLDPPGLFDHYYSEESIRLPDTFWCYDPIIPDPAVNELPALRAGHITFGSLNNFCKTNEATLALFARVLQAVSDSRLILLCGEGSHRNHTRDFLGQCGISANRITFVPRQSRHAYLQQYHQIDIGLDTLPYNGHTTSLDAFWMGVPIVTLVGETVVGRAGLSQLTNLGLTELIASTPDEFVAIVTRLSSDLPYLAQLRATLRSRMQNSPLMNAALFTRNMENTYRELFRRWCEKPVT